MMYHRYPLRSLIWDYCRTGAGLTIALVPLLLGKPGSVLSTLLIVLALLFLGYGLRTVRQHMTAYEIRPDGIASYGPVKRFFAWDTIKRIHLRYYSTARDKNRRDLKHGWLELKITARTGKLRIDSEVDGFPVILDAVANAALERQIDIDETSQENLKAFRGAAPAVPTQGGDD